jgi:glycosyltransferase involved in cell wall biosynthesis
MDWLVLSPFVKNTKPQWLMVHIDQQQHRTVSIPATYEHDRSRQVTAGRQWLDYLGHGWQGFRRAYGRRGVGIVTAFPQLAVIVALFKRVTGARFPLIAWCFNLAQPYGGMKGKLARFCLPAVDVFVVHSRAEIAIYSAWLQLPPERFVFVPLSAELPASEQQWAENTDDPYIVALGTANRDYALLAEAAGALGYRTVIVAGQHATAHITPAPCVSFRSGLSLEECHQLALGSRLNVIPIADTKSPSGQVTVIEAMMRGVPVVATACAGTDDYIESGRDGVLVAPRDVAGMKETLRQLWEDAALRQTLAAQGRRASLEKYTFAAAATRLVALMNQLAAK